MGYKFATGAPVPFATTLAAIERPADTIAVACCNVYLSENPAVMDTPDGFDAIWSASGVSSSATAATDVSGTNVLAGEN